MVVTTSHSPSDGIVWQPVTMASIKTDLKSRYPGMKTIFIKIFSSFCIILGLASIGVQIAALVMYATSLYYYVWFAADVVGHGIWAGSFYVVSGSLGIASAHKRTQSLLVSTVVFSSLSIASSIVASTLSGLAADNGCYCYGYPCYDYYNYNLCQSWTALEWSLMSISILASISSITLLVLTSIPLCCSGRNKNTIGYQQGVHLGPGTGQHPIYVHHQPMQLSAQQLYQPNFQGSYVTPQFQQQPQMQLVAASPAQQYTQAQPTPISVPQKPQIQLVAAPTPPTQAKEHLVSVAQQQSQHQEVKL